MVSFGFSQCNKTPDEKCQRDDLLSLSECVSVRKSRAQRFSTGRRFNYVVAVWFGCEAPESETLADTFFSAAEAHFFWFTFIH